VNRGQLIATIDSTNAAITLKNAELAHKKLIEPAKDIDITNSVNLIEQSYNTAFNAASTIYLDMPDMVSGMKDLFYGSSGFLSDQRSSYLSSMSRTYRDRGGVEYDAAASLYNRALDKFRTTTRSSATSTINDMLRDTYEMIKAMSKAANSTQAAITFIVMNQPDYQPAEATTAQTNITNWVSKINTDLSTLASSMNSIETNENSYYSLMSGTDDIDIEQSELTLEQARRTYSNYFIRAPYDGVIGRIPVNVYGQASGGTTIATIVGRQKIATISLDEVDASKVAIGQKVNITFDAIDDFTATGTVSEVDLIGVVSQGVVSYGVKITIDTVDSRVKPGMSVNTTIITEKRENVIVVPNSAVKNQGGVSYVQVFDEILDFPNQNTISSRRQFTTSSTTQRIASDQPLNQIASTQNQNRTLTISSATQPKQVMVVTGLSDDTNTEIVSGLNRGQMVVTRTIAPSGAQTTTAPSILNSLGARSGGGALRTGVTPPR